MAKIAIVGAGIAGLACGWRLQALGHEVELLESETVPGGRMRSERRGDFVVHRWDPMLLQFHAGYLPRLAAFLRRRERSSRLAFAGDYLVGPYTEAPLVSGLPAAGEVRALF